MWKQRTNPDGNLDFTVRRCSRLARWRVRLVRGVALVQTAKIKFSHVRILISSSLSYFFRFDVVLVDLI
jgi:hypothetical protein